MHIPENQQTPEIASPSAIVPPISWARSWPRPRASSRGRGIFLAGVGVGAVMSSVYFFARKTKP